jgi:hypothetical protein
MIAAAAVAVAVLAAAPQADERTRTERAQSALTVPTTSEASQQVTSGEVAEAGGNRIHSRKARQGTRYQRFSGLAAVAGPAIGPVYPPLSPRSRTERAQPDEGPAPSCPECPWAAPLPVLTRTPRHLGPAWYALATGGQLADAWTTRHAIAAGAREGLHPWVSPDGPAVAFYGYKGALGLGAAALGSCIDYAGQRHASRALRIVGRALPIVTGGLGLAAAVYNEHERARMRR